MFLEGEHGAFIGVASVPIWGYKLVSYIPVVLDDMLLFGVELAINNFGVDHMASQSEVVHNGVLGCNAILFLLGLKGVDKDFVVVTMVGGQD